MREVQLKTVRLWLLRLVGLVLYMACYFKLDQAGRIDMMALSLAGIAGVTLGVLLVGLIRRHGRSGAAPRA